MEEIQKVLEDFKQKRILVIGDISAAKCPSFRKNGKQVLLASSALISTYATNLGATVSLVGTVGPDVSGSDIILKLRKEKVILSGLVIDPLKPTLCWKKLHQGEAESHLNIITEEQMLESVLKLALGARAILYVSQNTESFSPKIYKEIKKVSKSSSIPLALFSRLSLKQPSSNTKKNDLFITHNNNSAKTSRSICTKTHSKRSLVINSKNDFDIVSPSAIKRHKAETKAELYQYEAALATMASLLLACYDSIEYLPKLAKHLVISNKGLSISK